MDDATSSRTRNRITRSGDDDAPDLVSAAPPEHDASELQDSAAHSVSTLPPALRRKRGLGFVTPKACSECRKRRAKCDGQQPCGRCKLQGRTTCHYDATVRQSKDDIRTELGSLRQEQQFTEEVLAAVAAPDTSDEALDRLRRGQSIRSISAWAKETRDSMAGISPVSSQFVGSQASHESGASLTASSMNTSADNSTIMAPAYRLGSVSDPSSSANYIPQSSPGKFYPEYELGSELGFSGLEQTLWPILVPTTEPTSENWTSITDDINLVHHLLALYFSWEYPIFAPFNKELFLRDFHNGRRRYCSSLLTNAILALSCRLSTLPITRLDPTDPASAGDHFFNEALLLFDQETDHRSLTTIQALGVMSMREISCGRDQESRYYAGQSMRLAVEMGLNRISEKAEEDLFCVQIFTFWGAFSLDSILSLVTGSLPQYSHSSPRPPKPRIDKEVEKSTWLPYTEYLPPQALREQPSNLILVYSVFCDLGELVHDTLYFLYSPVKAPTQEVLLSIYTKYLSWYSSIPEALRLGQDSTPPVLFAHMCYHFATLRLFRPFLGVQLSGSTISSADTSHQAADAIQSLLRSYSQLYTLLKTPSLVPYLTLGSAISHLDVRITRVQAKVTTMGAATSHHNLEAVDQDVADLRQMMFCHVSAEQALNVLGHHSTKQSMRIGITGDEALADEYERLIRPYLRPLWAPGRRSRRVHFLPPP